MSPGSHNAHAEVAIHDPGFFLQRCLPLFLVLHPRATEVSEQEPVQNHRVDWCLHTSPGGGEGVVQGELSVASRTALVSKWDVIIAWHQAARERLAVLV